MLKLFYEGFSNARRNNLIEYAEEAIQNNIQVLYILPSREAKPSGSSTKVPGTFAR